MLGPLLNFTSLSTWVLQTNVSIPLTNKPTRLSPGGSCLRSEAWVIVYRARGQQQIPTKALWITNSALPWWQMLPAMPAHHKISSGLPSCSFHPCLRVWLHIPHLLWESAGPQNTRANPPLLFPSNASSGVPPASASKHPSTQSTLTPDSSRIPTHLWSISSSLSFKQSLHLLALLETYLGPEWTSGPVVEVGTLLLSNYLTLSLLQKSLFF